ncbi:MAG: UDP-3-O-acyl-N-acetylglucosamine deacetylase [Isosphaeraceae bacterium]
MATTSRPQRTLASDTEVRGVGFFHSQDVTLRLRPAGPDTGVVFVRTDLPGCPTVEARIENVVPSPRRTSIRKGEATVEMIEHVMAALAGLQVDNCRIEIDGPEPPGLDGSSQAYVDAILAVGTVALDATRPVYVIDRPISVREGQAVLTAHPGDTSAGLVLSYQLDYGRKSPIGSQSFFLELTPESFARELAGSRTFLLESEARALRQAGIGQRAQEGDLLIFGSTGVLGNTLRFSDECVRHKILDMVGDLALLGQDIQGHVVAYRSGHSLNASLVRALVEAASETGDIEPGAIAATVPLAGADDAIAALDIEALIAVLPHRYPFAMVDRVLTLDAGQRLSAVKNLSFNEPFFPGSASRIEPIMPGVMLLEALSQAAGILLASSTDRATRAAVVSGIDAVRIGTPVGPGDQLRLDVRCLSVGPGRAVVRGVATVAGLIAAEATFQFATVAADRSAA